MFYSYNSKSLISKNKNTNFYELPSTFLHFFSVNTTFFLSFSHELFTKTTETKKDPNDFCYLNTFPCFIPKVFWKKNITKKIISTTSILFTNFIKF